MQFHMGKKIPMILPAHAKKGTHILKKKLSQAGRQLNHLKGRKELGPYLANTDSKVLQSTFSV